MSIFPPVLNSAVLVAIVGIAASLMPVIAASDVATGGVRNSTVLRRPFASNFDVKCEPVPQGHVLRASSCREAHRLIPTSDVTRNFGLRADGNCIIEVAETSGARGSYLDLSEAVEEMLELCVEYKEDHPEESTATNIGKISPVVYKQWPLAGAENISGVDGKLSLVMRSYTPSVQCGRHILLDNPNYSDEILRKMPATKGPLGFGRWRVPGVRIVLPLRYSSELVATVDVSRVLMETASWYDIWSATVAILGICVRQGQAGSASFLGDNGKIEVSIQERGFKEPPPASLGKRESEDA
ncbi:MAG: hypothetical protein Q9200_001466 [Gallowayella weberi]